MTQLQSGSAPSQPIAANRAQLTIAHWVNYVTPGARGLAHPNDGRYMAPKARLESPVFAALLIVLVLGSFTTSYAERAAK
jgi:hypothetical protein